MCASVRAGVLGVLWVRGGQLLSRRALEAFFLPCAMQFRCGPVSPTMWGLGHSLGVGGSEPLEEGCLEFRA